MSGISYMIDDKGQKTAAVIDLRRHSKVWEDIYDTLLVQKRSGEPRETIDAVKRRLAARRKPNG